MTKQPNVLFIIADQHNAKVLGHAGHPDVKTPRLDRLAGEGVRFENAVTQNCICTPSRVSFFSGQYCHNHGYYGLSGQNPRGLPTLLGHFRRAGYRTGAVGKIHCPEYWVEDDCDFFRETCGGCSIRSNPEYKAYLRDKGLPEVDDHITLDEFGPRGLQSCDARASTLKYEDAQEGWIVRQTLGFIEQSRKDNKPFIIQASLPRPHQCHTPSEPFWSMYNGRTLTLPANADRAPDLKAPHFRAMVESWRRRDWPLFEPKTFEAARARKLQGYLGSVSQVDHAVGELLDGLDRMGLAENTIVVYTADHGDYACEHGIMEKAPGICSDAITRIPSIWRWPGHFKAGIAAREIVEAVDLAPTLCAAAGLPPLLTADGKDLSSLLAGRRGEVHRIGVTENPWSKSVRKGPWRLVYYPREMFAKEHPDGFGELYNLEDDPWEMRNRFFEADAQPVVRELQAELTEWFITSTRPATIWPPSGAEDGQTRLRYHQFINADFKIHPDRIRQAGGWTYL
ncbi:MAG: sulfatase-like hydrolase/transferase [Lentisphaerae bacterium]|nr:sulfatase-like hydrolase/transferase [Lentisphaerota bacterium]